MFYYAKYMCNKKNIALLFSMTFYEYEKNRIDNNTRKHPNINFNSMQI